MNQPIDELRTLSVYSCARCGTDHIDVKFKHFASPIVDTDGTIWAWWALCPVTGDPIIMRDTEPVNDED